MYVRVTCVAWVLLCASAVAQVLPKCLWDDPEFKPGFYVQSIRFNITETISPAEAMAISNPLIGQCFKDADELSERVADLFQQHGFFRAAVGAPKLDVVTPTQYPSPVDVVVAVRPGRKYMLGDVVFTAAKAFPVPELRLSVPMESGDVFDVEKVRGAIRSLRSRYGEHGYINFTPVPNADIDEIRGTIRLTFDLDEGDQFALGKVLIIAPQEVADRLYAAWPVKPGAIYDSRKIWRFVSQNAGFITNCEETQDKETKTVAVRIFACPQDTYCPEENFPDLPRFELPAR